MYKYTCFICLSKHTKITQLIFHLKMFHNLNKMSLYQCRQDPCCRDLLGLKKFRQHLHRHHSLTNEVDNTNLILHSTEANLHPELPMNNLNSCSNINNSNIKVDYEISEEAILLNELVSISSNFGNQQQNIQLYKYKVEKSVLVFISKLANKPNVTSSLLQEIILGVISAIKNKVVPIIRKYNESQNNEIENMFDILENAFDNVKTEYHRTKFFIKNNLFFKPKTVVIGHYNEKVTKNNIDTVSMVPVHCHLLSMKHNLKYFFELPGVFQQ